jgi:hypothetical protein
MSFIDKVALTLTTLFAGSNEVNPAAETKVELTHETPRTPELLVQNNTATTRKLENAQEFHDKIELLRLENEQVRNTKAAYHDKIIPLPRGNHGGYAGYLPARHCRSKVGR